MSGRHVRFWIALLVALAAATSAVVVAPTLASSPPAAATPLPDNAVGRLFDLPLPGLGNRSSTPTVTGTQSADVRIAAVAVERGYQLHGEPLDPMGSYQGRALQQRAIDDLVDLQAALAADVDVSLTLTSAYRSATRQRSLFRSRLTTSSLTLRGRVVTNSEIGLGLADDVLNHAMRLAAPPGFSRHHTGLVIDVSSQGLVLFNFTSSAAYEWLTADNYANAMAYGWIPSYPAGASAQGPNPEPWEWAWIGRQSAKCAIEGTCAIGALDFVDDTTTVGWAVTPNATQPVGLRLVSSEAKSLLTVTWLERFDVRAVVDESGEFGLVATEGVPADAKWVCLEARTAPAGPWNRIDCKPT